VILAYCFTRRAHVARCPRATRLVLFVYVVTARSRVSRALSYAYCVFYPHDNRVCCSSVVIRMSRDSRPLIKLFISHELLAIQYIMRHKPVCIRFSRVNSVAMPISY
jgi:hypothetical protein